jgi:hypothetical protein
MEVALIVHVLEHRAIGQFKPDYRNKRKKIRWKENWADDPMI